MVRDNTLIYIHMFGLFLRCAIWDDQYFLIVSESSFSVLNTLNKIEVKRLYPHKICTEKSLKVLFEFPAIYSDSTSSGNELARSAISSSM